MRLKYSIRSSFFDPIHSALAAIPGCPDQEKPVVVTLSMEGYQGEVLVELKPDSPDEFLSDWEGNDETRFPVRIRAAATVLRDRGCFGRFLISHDGGSLTIVRAR